MFFFFKQKTAYEMRISDWSSDVCSSDLLLMRQSAGTVKKLAMELGGNAPFIVFDDADLDLAIDGVMASKFRNAGQTCVCANRILVQSGIHDAFVDRLSKAVRAPKVGHGHDPGVALGPQNGRPSLRDRVGRYV